MKQNVAILDLGTSKITVLIGSHGANGSICIDGIARCDYAGYCGGTWFEPEFLGDAIERALNVAMERAQLKINKLYVGVPGDFLLCETNEVTISLNKKRRVTDNDVETLYNQGNIYDYPDWTAVNVQPVYYTLDDDRKLIMPVGMTTTRLGGLISYILAKDEFIDVIGTAVCAAGVEQVEFVAAPLAEMLFLFDDYKRDRCVMLADVGALSTTLTIGRGDGLCRQYYFPWGGGRITLALEEALKIPRREAEKLKRHVILSLDPEYKIKSGEAGGFVMTEYSVEIDNEVHRYPVAAVNDVVKNEIRKFALYTEKALKVCDYEYPEFTPLCITGGGLNHIRGAAEWLSTLISRSVEAVNPSLPLLDIPQMSSSLGLLDMVLSSEAQDVGIAGRIRRLFSKRNK